MDKEKMAIARLREASAMSLKVYRKPLVVTTSGGKDSSVCVALAERAGIPFEVQHSHTTADAPETVYFVRKEFKRLEETGIQCTATYPTHKGERRSIIREWGPPNRWNRFCCRVLKEYAGRGRFIVTGVRWEESKKRKDGRGIYETMPSKVKNKVILNNDNDDKRRLFETCTLKAKRICNPIIDWTEAEVWEFLRAEKIPTNPLYEEGQARVGCVGCPLASTRIRYAQFARWPKYRNLYMLAFARNIEKRKMEGKTLLGDTAEEVFHWWMEDGVLPGQIHLDDLLDEMEDEE